MAKIVLTVDGEVLSDISLVKQRYTIGRKPHNDLVIDHVAISGEHVAIVSASNDWIVEDMHSTNGTLVNGQVVTRHILRDKDVIELTPYKIKFLANAQQSEQLPIGRADGASPDAAAQHLAVVKVLNGPSSGQEMILVKALTTIGRPGVQVAVVTHRKQGYFIAHVEGKRFPLLNGESIGANARMLKYDDVIDLSGTQLVFKASGLTTRE